LRKKTVQSSERMWAPSGNMSSERILQWNVRRPRFIWVCATIKGWRRGSVVQNEAAYCSFVPVSEGYWWLRDAPLSMSNSASRMYCTCCASANMMTGTRNDERQLNR
jgi:hypothetical protein